MLENTSSQPGFHPISNDSHHSNVQSYHADDISGLNNKSAQEFSNKGFFRISNSPFRREDHSRPVSSNASSRVVPREHDFSRNLDNSHHGLVEASCEEKNSSDEDRVSERSGEEEDKTAPERNKVETRTEVYHRRWYLLALFSFAALIWNAVWSTWGPIAEAAELVFGWDDGDIAMFTWLGNVPFLVTMFPIAYLMDVKGLRFPMVLCCGLMFLGTGLRCIPCDVKTAKWLINAGQFINGIAGTVPISGPALLSGLWFPPNQRATATALSTVLGYLGACVSFIVGPMLVPTPPDDPLPPTPPDNDSMLNTFDLYATNGTNGTDYSAQKDGIMTIMYFECGAAGLLFLLVAIYFPSKPPLPPSISASIPREKYLPGLKMLARNKQFWLTAIAYSVPIGVYEVWQVVLDVNLESRVTQEEAGWMDFYATIGGCVSGMLVCRFADIFTRQIRLFLVVFYFFSAVAILWCTLVFLDILPFDLVSIYAAIVIGGVFLDGGAPLFFELVIEVSYPVGEGVTSGLLQMMCSLSGIVFLSLLEVESIGKQWMNWCFFGSVTMAVPLLFFIKTSFGRADIDDIEVDVPDEEESRTTAELNDDYEKASLLKSVKT
ncbi:solute carrier family 49 member 4 homolog [Physella acuta]|uniref:solute carrier family 49 member 4 homolog n=1 Tax=Physella acuta TaxID=109671 RepID=UPI0027DC2852|nr:solute carrier family 49 member 4 homolog [Physella acuta]